MRWVAITVLALAVLGGCRHHRRDAAGVVPTVNARRMARLLEIGSRDLSCPTASLGAAPVTERLYRVTGCGNWADYAIFGQRHHARWRRVVPIAERVSADFACPAGAVTFTPVTATQYTTAGCGHAASYDLRCTDTDCGWVGTAARGGATGSTTTASVVIIVPAPSSPLSVDVDGEVDDDEGD